MKNKITQAIFILISVIKNAGEIVDLTLLVLTSSLSLPTLIIRLISETLDISRGSYFSSVNATIVLFDVLYTRVDKLEVEHMSGSKSLLQARYFKPKRKEWIDCFSTDLFDSETPDSIFLRTRQVSRSLSIVHDRPKRSRHWMR